ncbi:MAG: hypothetical protein O2798_00440 [Chloroflexi bacterium]|nr:hypothetical protein [Chloroflexota bacterium]MDA1239292.1 hypothetical protein [Chloroflexota bacterium]
MSAASLPYTVLLLLVELAVGSLAMLTVFDARRQVTLGYVKAGALTVVPFAALALWAFMSLQNVSEVDGYPLDTSWFRPAGVLLALFLLVAILHLVAAMREHHRGGILLGAAGSVVGIGAVLALGMLVAPAAWSVVGMLLSVLASTAVLGTANMAMVWGHWYLTSGRLPKEPMEQMALVVFGALLLQVVLVVAGTLIPPSVVPLGGSEAGLAQNYAYWLRVGAGLLFPLGAVWLAFKAAQIRGMMSATGLLYIALGFVLAGEVLARGLLFTTGAAV